jgi:GGDEF domain-containing protein
VDPQDLTRAVQQEIRQVLEDPALRGPRLMEALSGLGARHVLEPFRDALRALVALDRQEDQARATLASIEEHRASLEARLGRDPGLSVAALDYLHELEGTLRDPVFQGAAGPGGGAADEPADRLAASIDEVLAHEVRRGERFGRPLALLLVSPDPATPGPSPGGDAMLSAAAAALRGVVRDSDHLARVVPEGFAVILTCTGREAGLKAAERFRVALRSATGTTWSVGLASCPGQAWSAELLARAAREALFMAQGAGGDAAMARTVERREHPRRAVGASLTGRIRSGDEESEIVIEDLSLGGARIGVAAPLEPGSEVVLRLRETSARPREVTVSSRVVRAMPAAGGGRAAWSAGLAFLADAGTRHRVAGILADVAAAAGGPAEVGA